MSKSFTFLGSTYGLQGGSFSASPDYRNIEFQAEHGLHIFTLSDVSCPVYESELIESVNLQFNNTFLEDIGSLPISFVSQQYYKYALFTFY